MEFTNWSESAYRKVTATWLNKVKGMEMRGWLMEEDVEEKLGEAGWKLHELGREVG